MSYEEDVTIFFMIKPKLISKQILRQKFQIDRDLKTSRRFTSTHFPIWLQYKNHYIYTIFASSSHNKDNNSYTNHREN